MLKCHSVFYNLQTPFFLILILDTKLKKMVFGDYRKHYDILTLMKHFKNKPLYPYKKNIFYYFALLIRKIRNIKNSFGR